MNPRPGETVMVRPDPFEDDPMVEAKVVTVLAAQFIATYNNGRRGFFLYTGKGTTWKSLK